MSTPAPTNPFTIALLKAEIANDPTGLGLHALSLAGQDQAVANLLNATTGAGTGSVWNNAVSGAALIACIAAADFTAMTALTVAKIQLLFGVGGTFDATQANNQANLAGLFSGASAPTIAAATALLQRTGSRAEVLWGTGTTVSALQCSQAR
jgi:hypothetical protein